MIHVTIVGMYKFMSTIYTGLFVRFIMQPFIQFYSQHLGLYFLIGPKETVVLFWNVYENSPLFFHSVFC